MNLRRKKFDPGKNKMHLHHLDNQPELYAWLGKLKKIPYFWFYAIKENNYKNSKM
jgi:hypothetical protein